MLRVAIVDSMDETREVLQRELNSCSDLAWLEADCQRYDVFQDLVAQSKPDVAIVGVDGDSTLAIPLIQNLTANHPDLAIIAVSSNTDSRFASDLLRRGVRDFVTFPPREGELAEVMGRLAAAILPTDKPVSGGTHSVPRRVLAFAGTDGGIGSTTLAVNVGCILAQDPNYNVCLLDLDLCLGDAHVCLDMSPRTTLAQLVANIDTLDNAFLKRAIVKHESGLSLVPHPDKLSDAPLITPQHITRLITLLKRSFTHIILDLSKSFTPVDLAAMEATDEVLLTMHLDMSSLYNLLRLQEALDERPGLLDKTKLVANRTGSDIGISAEKAQETIGRQISFQIPNDTRSVNYARDNGKPLQAVARGSRTFQSIVQLANALAGRDRRPGTAAANPAPANGLLGRIFGRR